MSQPSGHHQEVNLALRNALKLTVSMLSTIAVAIIVRLFVPRFLGPGLFGRLSFADAFAATFYTFATFGVDTYIRKEVAANPKHAQDFYGGFFLVRTLTSILLLGITLFSLSWLHQDALTFRLVFWFALGQIAFIDNFTLGTFLQAASVVNALSIVNIISKIIWCVSIFVGLHFHAGVVWVAISFFISELLKTLYLMRITHRVLDVTFAIHLRPTLRVLRKSMPYFLNNIALRIYEKLNVILLKSFASDVEVGWYSAALNIAGFSLLFIPIVQAVLMPMAARMAQKSAKLMDEVMQQGAQVTLVLGTQIALVLALNAGLVVKIALGPSFAPTALGLMTLAPMFPLTYLATVCSLHLIQQNRTWTLIRVSLLAVLLNPILNVLLISRGSLLGPGGAGAMSAIATVLTELITCAVNLWLLGKAQLVWRFWQVVGRTCAICLAIIALHPLLRPFGLFCPLIEGTLYFALAWGLKTLPAGAIRGMLKAIGLA